MRRAAAALAAAAVALAPGVAVAGPPFLTDDPEPTDTGHWEIYAPLVDTSGRGGAFDGGVGDELNYGAARDLQLTLGLPIAFAHGSTGWRIGRGDLEASAKYRVYHDAAKSVSIAVFPGVTLPTAAGGLGSGRVTAFLPVWVQKDLGDWAVFGGAGYAINPGAGNRDYWSGGVAVSRQVTKRLLVGVEIDRQGADTVGGRGATSLGVGAIRTLSGPFRVLASFGPTFDDPRRGPGFYGFLALGIDL